MQVIINIPDEMYKKIKNSFIITPRGNGKTIFSTLLNAVITGIPLPKCYGRLAILSEEKLKENQIDLDFSCQKWISEAGISNSAIAISNSAIAIIEVDKEE